MMMGETKTGFENIESRDGKSEKDEWIKLSAKDGEEEDKTTKRTVGRRIGRRKPND